MRPRIGIARIWQETNSFSPKPTRLATRDDELAGFADNAGDIELVPLITAGCWPGGPAEPELVAAIFERLQHAVNGAGTLDGVLISLHGAMSGDNEPDVEGALLSLLRNMLGSSTPIVVTLDHHGNLTSRMISAATAITGYRECPHVDMRETGRRGATLLREILAGDLVPEMAFIKLPMVTPAEKFATGEGPMAGWFALARELEQQPGIRDVSLFPVQPWLDIPEFGWSVLVVGEAGQGASIQATAKRLADHAWKHRHEFTVEKWEPDAAVAHAARAERGPVVLADGADATNGGSPGDSTQLLGEMIEQRIDVLAFLTLVDPSAVAAAFAAGEGTTRSFRLGALYSTNFHRPVVTMAKVLKLHHGRFTISGHLSANVDLGRMALFAIGSIRVVVSERAGPGHDPAIFRHMGLEPQDAQIVVVKSTVGHLAAYRPFMAENLPVECRGPSPSRLDRLPHRNLHRPFFPFDPDMKWTAR